MASTAEVAEMITEPGNTVALTGAGISVASGMPAFRDENGERYDNETSRWAQREAFDKDPEDWYESFWLFYNGLQGLSPSAGHYALRDLVEASVVETVITQNVDSLDLLAGTPEARLLEVHGHTRDLSCANRQEQGCRYQIPTKEWLDGHSRATLPVCSEDGDLLKPDLMLVNDTYVPEYLDKTHHEEAPEALQAADTLMVVGTSFYIRTWFNAALWFAARDERSLIVVNPQPGPFDEYAQAVIHEPAEEALPEIRDLILS